MKSNSDSPFKIGNADIQFFQLQPDSSDPFLSAAEHGSWPRSARSSGVVHSRRAAHNLWPGQVPVHVLHVSQRSTRS